MSKGGAIAALGILTAALVAANGAVYMTKDRTKPEIHFPKTEMTYAKGSDESKLLKGVTATDNRDGDVTKSLRISSVIPNKNNTEVTVEYTAKDSSNNVRKISRTIPYSGSGNDVSNEEAAASDGSAEGDEIVTESGVDEDTDGDNAGEDTDSSAESSQDADVSANAAASQSTAATDATENAAAASDESEIASLTAGSPQIRLTAHTATIPVGGTFSYMQYIDSMKDDKDSNTTLAQRIELKGSVDTSKAGTYTVTYVLRDSNGNISNQPTLTVTVQ